MAHIPHLYLPGPWEVATISLSDRHLHHLRRVLRTGEGDPLSYTDGAGTVGSGNLHDDALARGEETGRPQPTTLTVAVAPPASRDRTRFLVEKLAELGVARLLWVKTRRTEGHFPAADKAEAWAVAALEQSRGAWLMELGKTTLADLDHNRLLVADPDGGDVPPEDDLILLVGPEGGLDETEVPDDARRLSLGPTILRVETAAITGAALLGRRGASTG